MQKSLKCILGIFIVLSNIVISQAQDNPVIVVTANATEGIAGFNDGMCSLTEAILNANSGEDRPDLNGQDCQPGNPTGSDTIVLTQSISIRNAFQELNGKNGFPPITTDITIRGDGYWISGDSSDFRIFYVGETGSLTLESVVLSNGIANSTQDMGDRGGSIINFGTLQIMGSTLRNNISQKSASPLNLNISAENPCYEEPQFVSLSTTSPINQLSSNRCPYSPRFINAAVISGGGAIYNYRGTIEIRETTFSENNASDSGGAILNDGGSVSVFNSRFIANIVSDPRSFDGGGAIYNFASGSILNVDDSYFMGNVGKNGGAILSVFGAAVDITDSIFVSNIATESGGGIHNHNGTLTLTNTVMDRNVASRNGGAILNMSGIDTLIAGSSLTNNISTNGAGVYNSRSDIVISESTISGNSTNGDDGGGLYFEGESVVEITNTTFSGNGAKRGAGVFAGEESTINLINTTLLQNVAREAGDAIFSQGSGVVITNTIIGDNLSEQNDCVGNITGTNNLDTDGTCPNSQRLVIGRDIDETLQLNEGSTATHALMTDSIAINAGDMSICPEIDQRGFSRNICDIGAFEAQ